MFVGILMVVSRYRLQSSYKKQAFVDYVVHNANLKCNRCPLYHISSMKLATVPPIMHPTAGLG
jgi:transposase-like protein